jgi:hypothetical protein
MVNQSEIEKVAREARQSVECVVSWLSEQLPALLAGMR